MIILYDFTFNFLYEILIAGPFEAILKQKNLKEKLENFEKNFEKYFEKDKF